MTGPFSHSPSVVGRVPAGGGCAAQKVGEHLKFAGGVSGADLVHRGVHPRVEAEELGVAVAERPDGHRAAVGRVAVTCHPAAAFEPVEDAGDGGRVQAGAPGERARADRAVTVDQVQAVEVDVVERNARADVVVQQRQLNGQLAQRLPDRCRQPPPARGGPVVRSWYGEKVRVVTADLAAPDRAVLESAVRGADALLSGLGPHSNADAGIAAPGTAAIVAAMQATHVRRIVVVSAAPVSTVPSPGRPTRRNTIPATGSSCGTCSATWPASCSARSTPT